MALSYIMNIKETKINHSIAIVIPARYGSSRLPGKPLMNICGQTLLKRVYDVAKASKAIHLNKFPADDVTIVIATDDQRIYAHAQSFDANCVLTSSQCQSGTDRVLEAALQLDTTPNWVINLQGDAPRTPPDIVSSLIEMMRSAASFKVVTPVTQLNWDQFMHFKLQKETRPFSGTTAIVNNKGEALWFSKQILPSIRNITEHQKTASASPVLRHLGLYGYDLETLKAFVKWPISYYEKLEGLEQLIFLENGFKIQTLKVDIADPLLMSGIDTQEDVESLKQELNNSDKTIN